MVLRDSWKKSTITLQKQPSGDYFMHLMSSKSLCVFGCGYVGQAVARAALDAGMRVAALTRNPAKAAALRAMGLDPVIEAELDGEAWHSQLMPAFDYTLNCVSSAGGGLDGYRKSYLGGQQSILRWAAKGRVGTLVYTSATSVYPQSDGERVGEGDVPADLSPSGEILRQAEALLSAQVPLPGIGRAFILRLGGIYGPERHYLLDKLRQGETTFAGSGDFIVNYIHRDDIVAAVLACFTAPPGCPGGVFNLVDGAYPTKQEIVEWLAAQTGSGPIHFDDSAQTEREGRRRNAAGQLPNRRVSNARIRQELGWEPRYKDFRSGYAPLLSGT